MKMGPIKKIRLIQFEKQYIRNLILMLAQKRGHNVHLS